jgi:ferrous iron transport protein B
MAQDKTGQDVLSRADNLRSCLDTSLHDEVTASVYSAAAQVVAQAVEYTTPQSKGTKVQLFDRMVTSRWLGFPLMGLLLVGVLWLTVAGANIPSAFLAGLLIEEGGLSAWFETYLGLSLPSPWAISLHGFLHLVFAWAHAPTWLSGFLIDGVYLGLGWVVAVMLPPMAIFFPLFTFFEDLGLLPRLAFNVDRLFKKAGGSGKQALTMAMGFGCNAAGVIACRIIHSPREKLIAIVTNNFVPCNGRWPTLIMAASLFVAAGFPAWSTTLVSTLAVALVTMVGVIATGVVGGILSRTALQELPSYFALELPPYRRPQLRRILYTSLIDRTLRVLGRAVICAAPAGGVIWLLHAIPVGEQTLFESLAGWLHPAGKAIGLDGIILLAFIFAIPANEIVIPTVIMGYMGLARMTEIENPTLLFQENGWTLQTAICLMLFSVLHYPCTTSTLTIWRETRSLKWTLLANIIPLSLALVVCFLVAHIGFLFDTAFANP